jgi:uncharacterized SAM-binding protein YcdF (DUF218 family)
VTRVRTASLAAGLGASSLLAALSYGAAHPPSYTKATSPSADGALVLSGDVDDLRTLETAALYHAGAFPSIILTGRGSGGDSAVSLMKVARRMGVPEGAIRLETASTTTRENFMGALPIIRSLGWKRVALVTNESHMGRAERAARKMIPDVEWVPIPVEDAGPPSRIYRTRLAEWVKLARYALYGWV